jgi:hypothetical protein
LSSIHCPRRTIATPRRPAGLQRFPSKNVDIAIARIGVSARMYDAVV